MLDFQLPASNWQRVPTIFLLDSPSWNAWKLLCNDCAKLCSDPFRKVKHSIISGCLCAHACVHAFVCVCMRANPQPSQRIICMLTQLQRAAPHCFFIVYFWKRSNVLLCWAHDSLLNTVESKINTASDLETQTQGNPVQGIRSTWAQLRPNLHVVFFSPEWKTTFGLSRISSNALLHSYPIL